MTESDDAEFVDTIRQGTVPEAITRLPSDTVHAVVTNPVTSSAAPDSPHEYQTWCEEWATACRQVLKPGGHLIAVAPNTQHHRLFAGIEDAGFDIRDTITWFVEGPAPDGKTPLAPSVRYCTLARAPLSEDTVAENVLEHGTGAINIDECRIPHDEQRLIQHDSIPADDVDGSPVGNWDIETWDPSGGRHPANVLVEQRAADRLDNQSGELSHGHWTGEDTDGYGADRDYDGPGEYGDTGGASRFFYVSTSPVVDETTPGEALVPDVAAYLVRLVAAEDQIVLDPFVDRGVVIGACTVQNRRFTGVSTDSETVTAIEERVSKFPDS